MKVKVQFCWCGGDKFVFRALICGGLLVRSDARGNWSRSVASEMLDLITANTTIDRRKVRFVHV